MPAISDFLRRHGRRKAPPRLTAVVAGDYSQFIRWCAEQGIPPTSPGVLYVKDAQSLRGHSNLDVVRTGSWYSRADFAEIENMLRIVHRTAV